MHVRNLLFAFALSACAVSAAPNADRFPDAAYSTFSAEPLAFELRTAPSQPPERGVFSIELSIVDAAGAPRDGLSIDVTPFMGAHGHGASGHATVTPLGEGRYRVDHLELSMPGFWQLAFAVRGEGVDTDATATLEVR